MPGQEKRGSETDSNINQPQRGCVPIGTERRNCLGLKTYFVTRLRVVRGEANSELPAKIPLG